MSSQVLLITSLKGGCGKSTVCAHLAFALAEKEKRCLLLSLDKYNNSLDIIFECESVIFDLSDYPERSVDEICIPLSDKTDISLALCMPYSEKELSIENILNFIKSAKESEKYDYILIDKSFDSIENITALASCSDKICVISTQSSDSIRSCELLGDILYLSNEEEKASLILNHFYTDPSSLDFFPGISQIISQTKLPLLAIIPFSDEICATQTSPLLLKDANIKSAFSAAAERLLGRDEKFLTFLPTKNRRIILNNKCSGGNKL